MGNVGAGHYLPKYFTTPMMERLKADPAAKGYEFEYYPAEQMGKAKDFLSLVQSGFKPEQKQNFGGARYGWKMMGGKLVDLLARIP